MVKLEHQCQAGEASTLAQGGPLQLLQHLAYAGGLVKTAHDPPGRFDCLEGFLVEGIFRGKWGTLAGDGQGLAFFRVERHSPCLLPLF